MIYDGQDDDSLFIKIEEKKLIIFDKTKFSKSVKNNIEYIFNLKTVD